MAKHKLQINFDEDTGELVITHRCEVDMAGHKVRYSEEVQVDQPVNLIEALKDFISNNRAEVEQRASRSAIQHVAAVTGKTVPGQKRIRVVGTMGPVGDVNS